ncbi:MAG: phosphomannomutase/phosphoglucomutase [Patescibacteria group bacterium]
MKIDEAIFRTYDIRGVYPDEINGQAAFKIGQAFATYIGGDVVIGCDVRNSSPELFERLAAGVNSVGRKVYDLGICTTPMLNFAVADKKFAGGMMITASHNPGKYNGIKLVGRRAIQFMKDLGISEIKELVFADSFEKTDGKKNIESLDILTDYSKHLLKSFSGIKKMKIIVDCGNGVGAISAKPVFEKLGLDVTWLYPEPDGNYPNHPANPAEEKNLVDLISKIKQITEAEIGIAFDGDADRAFFIDENGAPVNIGFLLAAIATEELRNHHDEKIYYDLRFSHSVAKTIKNAGGIPIKTKVGNPFYKSKMIKEGGLMGAEMSGHFMYSENYCLDDGLFSALKILYWLSKTGKSLSEFVEPYSRGYFVSGEVNLEVSDTKKVLEKLKEKYSTGKIEEIDGVTVEYSDWWFNLRASNTEPVVRLNIEANSKVLLAQKKTELVNLIK